MSLYPIPSFDGGVFANNPSLCAIAQALDRRWRNHPRLGDIRLLSIGSGQRIAYSPGDDHHWGLFSGERNLLTIPVLMEASPETMDENSESKFGKTKIFLKSWERPPNYNNHNRKHWYSISDIDKISKTYAS